MQHNQHEFEAREKKILTDFQAEMSWEEKYSKIIAYGRRLPEFPEKYRMEDNKVRGCQSQVWMFAELQNEKIHYFVDSDALIVKGLSALLLELYQDVRPEDAMSISAAVFEKIGLQANLSPNRASGFQAMLKQMKMYAMAFQYQMKT